MLNWLLYVYGEDDDNDNLELIWMDGLEYALVRITWNEYEEIVENLYSFIALMWFKFVVY